MEIENIGDIGLNFLKDETLTEPQIRRATVDVLTLINQNISNLNEKFEKKFCEHDGRLNKLESDKLVPKKGIDRWFNLIATAALVFTMIISILAFFKH
jgi:hypothetical protein